MKPEEIVVSSLRVLAGAAPGVLALITRTRTDDEAIEAARAALGALRQGPAAAGLDRRAREIAYVADVSDALPQGARAVKLGVGPGAVYLHPSEARALSDALRTPEARAIIERSDPVEPPVEPEPTPPAERASA